MMNKNIIPNMALLTRSISQNKNNKDHISNFDLMVEYMNMFNFRTSASNNIRSDVMHFAINNLKRKESILLLAQYVPINIADRIEQGVLEFSMVQVSNEPIDALIFTESLYKTRINDIAVNLDQKNVRINNKTLSISLIDGSMDPYFVAFMTPQQMHPVRWSKELEKRRIAEAACNDQKVTDIYKCRKCGDRKSTTTQMQTRSADEPMTIFVTCLTCYNTFTTQ